MASHRALLGGGLLAVLGGLAACTPQHSQVPPVSLPDSLISEPTPFLGNDACKPCHAAEFESHQHSRHLQTFHDATIADLGALAPAPGPVPGGGTFTVEQGRFVADSPVALTPQDRTPLKLVLGSGKTGITFMALFDTLGAEIRQSYFPATRTWHLTPGQEKAQEGRNARLYTTEETRQCLSCHAVTLPLTRLMPERKFFGVGCESCHGAGSEHVAAMQSGKKPESLSIVTLRGATGDQINEVCGRCHRTAEDVSGMSASAKAMTQRFQPYGLSLSQCFKQSGGKLSCTTCHNPHQDASKDQLGYDKTCLSCHSQPKTTCPVNPKEKCVSCHMPTRAIFTKSKIPISMADHFIRIYKDGKPTR